MSCVQSAVEHEENRNIIEELTAHKAKPNAMMEKMGLNVEVSNDGKVHITKKQT